MVMDGDLTSGGEYVIDNVLYNSMPETYILLLTDVTTINTIKKSGAYQS